MNCQTVILELTNYLDGDLDQVAFAELELHLSRCKDCRIIVDTTRKTIDIYCKAEPAPLPEGTRTRLHEALRKHLTHRPPP